MKNFATKILLASALTIVSACSGPGFPPLIGNDSQENILNNGNIIPATTSTNTTTGTFAGQKIRSFRQELEQLKTSFQSNLDEYTRINQSLKENFTSYNSVASTIENTLHAGTTPSTPELSALFDQAQNNIQNISAETKVLNALAVKIDDNASTATRLHNSVDSALGLSCATEEDRLQMEKLLKENKDLLTKIKTAVRNASSDSIRWHQNLNTAKNKIGSLDLGIRTGKLSKTASAKKPTLFGTIPNRNATSSKTPLFIAKIKNDDNHYKEGLGTTIKAAINSKNNTAFDVIAISDSISSPKAWLYAKKISEEIKAMGINPDDINLSEEIRPQIEGAEVWIFAR